MLCCSILHVYWYQAVRTKEYVVRIKCCDKAKKIFIYPSRFSMYIREIFLLEIIVVQPSIRQFRAGKLVLLYNGEVQRLLLCRRYHLHTKYKNSSVHKWPGDGDLFSRHLPAKYSRQKSSLRATLCWNIAKLEWKYHFKIVEDLSPYK